MTLLLLLSLFAATPAPAPDRVTLTVDGGAVDVVLPPGSADPWRANVLEWIRLSAHAVGNWYGTFPVSNLRIDLRRIEGDGVAFATTWPGRPPHIDLPVGKDAGKA